MTARRSKLVVLSGTTGVVGTGLACELLRVLPDDATVAGIFRGRASFDGWRAEMGPAVARVVPIYGDLARAEDLPAMMAALPPAAETVGIHCAADVAWDKALDEVREVNVGGSLRFAALVAGADAPKLIYVSSAYTRLHDWDYRNAYEQSKAMGERALRDAHPSLPVSTFSCSLVIGNSHTGAIRRFHGLYPLVKLLACMAPPFLVGRPDCLIDIVPIDWVARELAAHALRLMAGDTASVVAAAGPGRMRLADVVSTMERRIGLFRSACGFPDVAPLTVLPFRRWAFLRRSLERWRPAELAVGDFRYFERLLDVYKPYTESDAVQPPFNVTMPAPDAPRVLERSVDHWLELNAGLVRNRLSKADGRRFAALQAPATG